MTCCGLRGGLADPPTPLLPAERIPRGSVASERICGPVTDVSRSSIPSQLGNRCLALRTSSSMSCDQFVLPEGEPPRRPDGRTDVSGEEGVCVGESWEHAALQGDEVGVPSPTAVRDDVLGLHPFFMRCVLAASVTGWSAEEDEFCEHVSRFPWLLEW